MWHGAFSFGAATNMEATQHMQRVSGDVPLLAMLFGRVLSLGSSICPIRKGNFIT